MTRVDRMKERKRRERRLAKQQQEAQELAKQEEMFAEEPLETETPEEVEKDYNDSSSMMGGMMEMMGPTSFEELDAEREARTLAEEVNGVTWDVQDLVRNILHSPMLEPPEKATRIKDVAGGFEERVTAMMDGEELEKDLDVLQIQAILATESRNRGPLSKAWEGISEFAKRQLTGSARKKLADSDFALPEKRKYPIHDKAHVRNALARAAQQMKAGGEGAADAKAAMPRIRAAAKKFGIDMSMEKGILIEKDAKGDWRWIGKPSNNFIDRQLDIMSKAAHEKYCAWLDENRDMAPLFLKWHTPGTQRESPVDFWMEHEGALIMSGVLTESEAAELLRMQKEVDLGMSVQGIGLRLNQSDPREITDYWLYEVSDLPLEYAANPFTSLETITKEAGMNKLEYLAEMMGSKEKAEDFLKRTGQMQKDLQAAGITSKEDKPDAAEKPAAEGGQSDPPTLDVEALIKRFKEEFKIDDLNAFVAQAQEDHDKVAVLESLIKDLQKGDDERLAEQLTPPVVRLAWSRENRPSQRDATKISKDQGQEEDKKLAKAQPGVEPGYWLSEVTGTAPIVQEVQS